MQLRATLVAAAAFATAIPAASAQELIEPGAEMMVGGNFYVGGGYRFQTIKLPRIVNAMRALPSANALLSLRPELAGHGANGSLGYAFRDGTFPAWLGQNQRVEVGGYWVSTGYASAAGNFGSIASTSLILVDGSNSVLTGLHLDTYSSIRVTAQRWQLWLRFATDYPVAPQWIVSPEIAIIGGRQYDDYKTFERGQQTFQFRDSRTYDLNTSRIGGQVGGRVTYKLREWLAIHVGGYVGALHSEASLRAFEEFQLVGGTTTYTTVNASRSTMALIAGGQAGLTIGFGGPVILVLSGGIDYDSRVAGVRVPTFADGGPAGITFKPEVNYTAMATLKVRIY
ncbi:MAG: hypothetical protein KIT16_14230 [Rhodospirillaceae bacterium]|nr:hypothetical protein [Rhodospirillaceae bacterium]